MSRRRGVLVDGPLEGSRVLVHLFARAKPMPQLLVFARPPGTALEWLRWWLWREPPDAVSYPYRVHGVDDRPQPRYELASVRYVYDDEGLGRDEPTEIVFAVGRRGAAAVRTAG